MEPRHMPNNPDCKSNKDCNNGAGICWDGICECKPELGHVGNKCQFPDPCLSSPCQNGGKCIAIPDSGSFYCDCKVGFLDQLCTVQDPCIIGGKRCLNGSTCRKKDEFEFVCECQYPYSGTYCETYDLCLVDEDECVDDLNVEEPEDPRCAPCSGNSKCYQMSVREHACICPAGIDDPSCHSISHQQRYNFKPVDEIISNAPPSYWNPIIPSIALTTCAFFFIFLIIAVIFLRKIQKRRPRLIICCDLDYYAEHTYYLLSVETGRQFKAGTKANIFCFLCGEGGQAGPFPLNDANLREVHVLERHQEDNYLVSCPTDLGRLTEIVIFHDPRQMTEDSWFCRRITVRNIKTDDHWFFYISTWIQSKKVKKKAASAEIVRKHEIGHMNTNHVIYHLTRNHVYIAPFCHSTPVKITLAFAELMTYMLFLIVFYGFLIASESVSESDYEMEIIVLVNGSIVAAIGFALGILYALFFALCKKLGIYRVVNSQRIPTLIVGGKIKNENPSIPSAPIFIEIKEFRDAATMTDPEPPVPIPRKRRFVPQQKESLPISKDHLFRIPSTDIMKMEEWVPDVEGGEDVEHLVHDYQSHYNLGQTKPIPSKVMRHGLLGSLRDNRQQNPQSFVYKTDSLTRFESAMERDIRAAYENVWPDPTSSVTVNFRETWRNIPDEDSGKEEESGPTVSVEIVLPHDKSKKDTQSSSDIAVAFADNTTDGTTKVEKSTLAGGDFPREEDVIKENTLKEELNTPEEFQKTAWELCELGEHRFGKSLSNVCMVFGWFICVAMIITSTVICCIYGGRYGDQRTYDWCISLLISWLQNFLIYQFLKLLFLVCIITCMVMEKIFKTTNGLYEQNIPTYEAKRIHERLQVLHEKCETESELQGKYPLKYVEYPPAFWKKIPSHVTLKNDKGETKKKKNTESPQIGVKGENSP